MRPIDEQLQRIRQTDRDRSRKRVVILGAGVAGLVAAYELHKLGHAVEVIEGSGRVGGRVRTHRFKDDQYNELGAMRIPASHDYTRHYISVCNLKLRPFVTAHKNLRCFYDIRGIQTRIEDASKTLFPQLSLSPAERRLANAAVAPAILGSHFSEAILNLTEDDERDLFTFRPSTLRALQLDSQSLLDFLQQRLRGSDTLELIGSTTGLEMLWNKSMAMFLRDEIIGTGDGLEEIEGGMDLLPTGLAKLIPANPIRLNTEVIAIHWEGNKGKILLSSDKHEPIEIQPTHVICTIPFPVLRRLDLAGFTSDKMRAIRNLTYASSTKVLIHCKRRFWEQSPYDIVGGATLSDQIIRSTYYPSDNAPVPGPPVVASHAKGVLTAYSLEGRTVARNPEISNGPGVLLGSYCWGADARRLGGMSANERAACVIDKIARFHPEIRDFADDHASMSWDDNKWAGGAFSFLEPSDQARYLGAACQSEGDFHFAGEHCSTDQAWIQGAAMSALRAVEEIVSK
jgi:monoamine oxidase